MEVILSKDVPNVGRMGELVQVKPGFARNFLLPRSMAVIASNSNKKALEHQKRIVEAEKKKVRSASEELAKDVSKVKIQLKKRFNDQDKMFGSIAASEIVQALKEKGHEFDRRDVEIGDIREAGTYAIKLRLPGDVFTEVQLKIEPIKEEGDKPKRAKSSKKTEKAAAAASEATQEEEQEDKTSAE